MPRPDAYPYERRVQALLDLFASVQRQLTAEVRAAVAENRIQTARQRRAQLARVLEVLDQAGVRIDRQASELVNAAFTQGAGRALSEMNALNIAGPTTATFAGVSAEAVQVLQESIVGRLEAARRTVGRNVQDVFARAQRDATMRALLGAEGSPQAASRQLQRSLEEQGLTGFTDAAEKRWSLKTYSEMAVRTVTREAVVQGAIIRMAAHGVNLARVSIHGTACPICIQFEGRLVSLDGATSTYRGEPVMDMGRLPPYHPNCKHTLQPVSSALDAVRDELFPPSAPDSIGTTLDPVPGPVSTITNETVAVIDKVHRTTGEMGRIPVTRLEGGDLDTQAYYNAAPMPAQRFITIRTNIDAPTFTMAHELGHFIDHTLIGTPGVLASRAGHPALAEWRQAVRSSNAYTTLRAMAEDPAAPQSLRLWMDGYFTTDVELLARSYAQWIAIRSQDPVMLRKLAEELTEGAWGGQWLDTDFEAIAAAFDNLFRSMGLLQ